MKAAPLSRRDRLRQILADLRMPGALEALDAILQGIDGGTLTASDAIEQLLTAQIQLRNNRRLQAAMRSSRLPAVKQLHDFDFTFQPSLRREQIESLHELGFVCGCGVGGVVADDLQAHPFLEEVLQPATIGACAADDADQGR